MNPRGFPSSAYSRAHAREHAPNLRRLRGLRACLANATGVLAFRRLDANPRLADLVVVLALAVAALVAFAHVVDRSLSRVAPDLHAAIADVPRVASERVSAAIVPSVEYSTLRQHWNTGLSAAAWKVERLAHALDPKSWKDHGPLRDEYGHLTFDAQCQALMRDGIDPGWPLARPSDAPDGMDGSPFADAKALCDYMNALPEKLKVYTFALPSKLERRYQLARLAPTFNRAYDVEAHVIGALGKPPFATTHVGEVRSISHWFPYDRVGVVNADP